MREGPDRLVGAFTENRLSALSARHAEYGDRGVRDLHVQSLGGIHGEALGHPAGVHAHLADKVGGDTIWHGYLLFRSLASTHL